MLYEDLNQGKKTFKSKGKKKTSLYVEFTGSNEGIPKSIYINLKHQEANFFGDLPRQYVSLQKVDLVKL